LFGYSLISIYIAARMFIMLLP